MEWKGATGRVRGGALLNKDAQSCVSPPNDPGEGYSLGAGAIRLLQSPLPHKGGVGTVGKVTRRDDCQASSWPSWIEALCFPLGERSAEMGWTRDEPTDLLGMCAFLHNSSVDLRDPACSLVGAGAQKPENIRRWDLDCVMATQR